MSGDAVSWEALGMVRAIQSEGRLDTGDPEG
jgi:hypothetical protein